MQEESSATGSQQTSPSVFFSDSDEVQSDALQNEPHQTVPPPLSAEGKDEWEM